MTDIKSMNKEALEVYIKELGFPRFRAVQIYDWIHKKHVKSFDEMKNLPQKMREKLATSAILTNLKMVACYVSEIDDTHKYLFALEDGNIIESVMMRYEHGNSVCISTQVGCRMGCRFCASTIDGLLRNLTVAEMLEQVYAIQRDIGGRVSNIVTMGAGEPMDNFENVLGFIEMVSDVHGLHISQRNITVSTCGIAPKILELAQKDLAITLALSLHAPSDTIRKTLMPIANRYSIKEVLSACDTYYKKTKRRVTFEYSLVADVNDNEDEARALIKLIGGRAVHVNLIPVNPIKERDFKQSTLKNIRTFKNILEKNGINATIRREMGRDINGACGQLRRSHIEQHID